MNTRCIHEDQLRVLQIPDTRDPVSCRLGFVGGDGDFFAHKPVEERRLPDVRPSNNPDESGLKHFLSPAAATFLT